MKLLGRLFERVDCASLVAFRVLFGGIMIWEVCRYFAYGWIPRYFITPEFHFKYYGFEWVTPLPGAGMYLLFAGLGILAACIMLGAFYRAATMLFFLGFSYVFLIDQATYLNHFYLVILISFLMIFLPANRAYSVDAMRRPEIRSDTVPAWSLWLLLAQFEVMLIYAGLVKINADWLNLEPLRTWLQVHTDWFLIGPLFMHDWFVALGAYGSIALHVIGAPLLLFRRTRLYVFAAYCCFHVMNHFVFSIGIFPWFTIAGTLLFFSPSWPRQVADRLSRMVRWIGFGWTRACHAVQRFSLLPDRGQVTAPAPAIQYAVAGCLVFWVAVQVLVPARHHLYPGNPSWTEEGHRFAWQMMLRMKRSNARFEVRDPASGRAWDVDMTEFLTHRQVRKMQSRPDMILQFAHHLADVWKVRHGVADPQVRADVFASLNRRRQQRLIDPKRDLAKVERNLRHADWIVQLYQPPYSRREFTAQN